METRKEMDNTRIAFLAILGFQNSRVLLFCFVFYQHKLVLHLTFVFTQLKKAANPHLGM